MSDNGRMREDTLANILLRFEYLRDIPGPTGTKSGACTVRVEREPSLPASRWHTRRLPSQVRLL